MSKVTSVPDLDLTRYMGQWFEIGRLPLKWEDPLSTDVTATYAPDEDDTVSVDNRCFDEEGKPTQSKGRAKLSGDSPSQLHVSFLPEFLRWIPFTEGDYWVLKIDSDYTVALVGTPDTKHLWLLAREHTIDQAVEQEYLGEAARQGFDLAEWIRPVQTDAVVTDADLEAANS